MSNPMRQFTVIHHSEEPVAPGLLIAFATDDNHTVNQHFGSAKAFAIYEVSLQHYRMKTIAEFDDPVDLDNEDKLIHKLDLLEDCVAVYCRACGSSAVRQLLERNIQPLKLVEDAPIKSLLSAFQKELNEGPSNWLAKALLRQKMDVGKHPSENEFWHE